MAEQIRSVRDAMDAGRARRLGSDVTGIPASSTPHLSLPSLPIGAPAGGRCTSGWTCRATAGTSVHALADGVVERVDDESIAGGYGPVITLRHEPADGPGFFTLYGHLDRAVDGGGGRAYRWRRRAPSPRWDAPPDNGNWPPHLHFQLMTDLLDLDGPFPGVALPDHWTTWSSLCPSPAAALGLTAELVDATPADDERLRSSGVRCYHRASARATTARS